MDRPRVALIAGLETFYEQGILRGVARYGVARGGCEFATHPWETGSMEYDPADLADCDGLLIARLTDRERELLARIRPGCKVVGVLEELEEFGLPLVLCDQEKMGTVAAEHLLSCGLENFACVGHYQTKFIDLRLRGFHRAIESAGHSCRHYDPDHRLPGDWNVRAEREDIRHWLCELPRPVGLFASSDRRGCQLTQFCRELDLRVPDDIAIVGADNIDVFCEFSQPPLTSVPLDFRRVGYEAARMLCSMVAGEPAPSEPVLVPPGEIIARRSTEVQAVRDPQLADALQFIRSHACEGIRVSDVLAQVKMGRRTLEKSFRNALGRSPFEEIRRVQVQQAKRLLSGTDLAVQEVASQVGLSDGKYLSEVFRKACQMSPTEYRRQFRGD